MTEAVLAPFHKAARTSYVWEREGLDHYVEPAWIWDALFARPSFRPGMSVIDPACGFGRCVDAACRAGLNGHGSDVLPRWEQLPERPAGRFVVTDFIDGPWPPVFGPDWCRPDVIATNPPFKQAKRFIELALARTAGFVCAILPSSYAQGLGNARWLAGTPLLRVLFICPRPSMPPGHVVLSGGKIDGGKTDFAMFCWLKGYDGEPGLGHLIRPAPAAPVLRDAE